MASQNLERAETRPSANVQQPANQVKNEPASSLATAAGFGHPKAQHRAIGRACAACGLNGTVALALRCVLDRTDGSDAYTYASQETLAADAPMTARAFRNAIAQAAAARLVSVKVRVRSGPKHANSHELNWSRIAELAGEPERGSGTEREYRNVVPVADPPNRNDVPAVPERGSGSNRNDVPTKDTSEKDTLEEPTPPTPPTGGGVGGGSQDSSPKPKPPKVETPLEALNAAAEGCPKIVVPRPPRTLDPAHEQVLRDMLALCDHPAAWRRFGVELATDHTVQSAKTIGPALVTSDISFAVFRSVVEAGRERAREAAERRRRDAERAAHDALINPAATAAMARAALAGFTKLAPKDMSLADGLRRVRAGLPAFAPPATVEPADTADTCTGTKAG